MLAMNEFIKISKYAGMREDIVQAGGGNSSVKISDSEMLIKSSGYQMAEISENTGFSRVNYKAVSEFMVNNIDANLAEEVGKKILSDALIDGKRPSIETFLHSITAKITLHTHPILVNVLTARTGGMHILAQLFPKALLIDYATPGIKLAQIYFQTYRREEENTNHEFDIIFLKNHGLIVSAETADSVIEKTNFVVQKIADFLRVSNQKYSNSTLLYNKFLKWNIIGPNKIIYLSTDKHIYEMQTRFSLQNWQYSFCPDCLVYCNKKPFIMNINTCKDEAIHHIRKFGDIIVIFFDENIYIVADNVKKAKEIESVLSFSAHVAMLNEGHHMDILSEQEQDYVLNWESEQYRKNLG